MAQYLCFNGGMPANRDNMTKAIDADGEDGELLIVTYNETSVRLTENGQCGELRNE